MKIQNPLVISLIILLAGFAILGFVFGAGCGSGWIQLTIGDSPICAGPPELPPCPNPADCVRDVAKLVSVEAYPVQARLEFVNQPDLADWLNPVLTKVGLEERFIILAYGRVVAGFDLQKIKDDDVWSDGKHIRIQLPPPEILYEPNIDNTRTEIISDGGLCPGLICHEAIELTGPALVQVQEQMRTASVQELHLLDQAAESARDSLTNLFLMLGYEKVEILIDQHPI